MSTGRVSCPRSWEGRALPRSPWLLPLLVLELVGEGVHQLRGGVGPGLGPLPFPRFLTLRTFFISTSPQPLNELVLVLCHETAFGELLPVHGVNESTQPVIVQLWHLVTQQGQVRVTTQFIGVGHNLSKV